MSASEDYAMMRKYRKKSNPYTAVPRKNAERKCIFVQCQGCRRFNIPIDDNKCLCPECEAEWKKGFVGELGRQALEMVTG